jgi:hypothetical protein
VLEKDKQARKFAGLVGCISYAKIVKKIKGEKINEYLWLESDG